MSTATESTEVKNDFSTHCRTLLVSASCFTAQFTSMAQQVAVATVSPHLRSNAQGLCQNHSVSQTVRMFHPHTAMGRKERHGPSAVHDNIIHPTDGHEDRNVCGHESKHHFSLLKSFIGGKGRKVSVLTAIR